MSDARLSFITSVADGQRNEAATLISGTLIRIAVGPQAGRSLAGQALVYQLTTLTARLFDRVELSGDEGIVCHPAMVLLSGTYIPALRSLLPTLREPVELVPETGRTLTIVVGSDCGIAGDLYLGASSWGARFSMNNPQTVEETTNPLGGLAAGCLGAAEAFKAVFDGLLTGAHRQPEYTLSLLTYGMLTQPEPSLPAQVPIDAVLFGCGSIGCGFLLGLLLTPQLCGDLTTVDNGVFDTRNPYKYSLIDWRTAQQADPKAVWAERQIHSYAPGRLSPRSFVGVAEEYVASLPVEYTIPLAISAVDTAEARLEIQDTLPRRIVNAGIDGTLAEVSVHGFGDGACLGCLSMRQALESWDFPAIARAIGLTQERVYRLIRANEGLSTEDVAQIRVAPGLSPEICASADEFLGQPLLSFWNRVAYSETVVRSPGAAPAKVTTAFVSAFAGVLLLAEIVKQAVPELWPYRVDNSYQQQLLGVPAGGVFRHERDSHGWCLCHSSYRLSIYRDKYGTTSGTVSNLFETKERITS